MSRILKFILAIAFAAQFGIVLLLASVPPVSRDALTHHLALPKLWIADGILHDTPDIVFSYYPQLLDLLYALPVMLGSDIAAKYLHFLFALLTAGLIFVYVRRRLSATWAGCAALMYLTVPVILKLSVTVYVDLGLVFFSTASLSRLIARSRVRKSSRTSPTSIWPNVAARRSTPSRLTSSTATACDALTF